MCIRDSASCGQGRGLFFPNLPRGSRRCNSEARPPWGAWLRNCLIEGLRLGTMRTAARTAVRAPPAAG
eukprot:14763799-Alexandrium_andersonii.AAC.1